MLNLQRMTMFVAVVESGSFTAAAAALGQTKAVVSFNVRQLESELGVTLLLRSTRRLTLTEAGSLFYHRGLALLKTAENLQDEVRASHSGLSGETPYHHDTGVWHPGDYSRAGRVQSAASGATGAPRLLLAPCGLNL